MSLADAMFDALERARDKAIREQSQLPMGFNTMSQTEGQQALDRLRSTPPRAKPRYELRPLPSDIAQVIHSFIATHKRRPKTYIEYYKER